jgi:hypothetical protein
MRSAIACVALLCSVAAANAQNKEDGAAIVEKAVKAHGGKEKIAQLRIARVTWTLKGTLPGLPGGGDSDLTIEETYQLPRQMKKVVKGTFGGMAGTLTWSLDGDTYWYREGNQEVKVQKNVHDHEKILRVYQSLEQLPAMLGKEYELTALGESEIKGKKVLGVRARSEKLGSEVNLYFDKVDGLLRATRAKNIHPTTKKEILGESHFSDYKEVDGVQLFFSWVMSPDGQKTAEILVKDVRFFKKLDDSVFAPPAK